MAWAIVLVGAAAILVQTIQLSETSGENRTIFEKQGPKCLVKI
jgi:hypothetical protein